MKVTLKQIAEKADVSISLVSKVLNGKEVSVTQEKREKILQFAEQLKGTGRESGRLARSLRTPNVIALIQPNIRFDFLADLTEEAINWANQHGYDVAVLNSGEDIQKERELLEISQHLNVKGLIVNACDNSKNLEIYQHLKRSGMPLVFMDRYLSSLSCSFVATDNFFGATEMTQDLIRRGHRNILFVFHGKSIFTTVQFDRFAGYQKAMETAGLDCHKEYIYSERPLAQQPIYSDFSSLKKIDAIVLASSWDLPCMLEILEQHEELVSPDLDIAAFDYFSLRYPVSEKIRRLEKYASNLIIMEQDHKTMARKAVDMLLRQITRRSNAPEEQLLITPILRTFPIKNG